MVAIGRFFWPVLEALGIAIASGVLLLLASHFWRRLPKPRRAELVAQLLRVRRFPKRSHRLLKILMSARTFRVESLWEKLNPAEIEQLHRTAIPAQLRRLANRGPKWQRVRAMLLLGLLKDAQAIGLLRRLAVHKDEDLAAAAVRALGHFDDEHTSRFLLGLLSNRYTLNGSRVASVVEGIQRDLSLWLMELLHLGDTRANFWAATLLGRYDHPEVRLALVKALQDNNPNVRAAACDSLGRIGNVGSARALINALTDPAWYVRAHAALACGRTLIRESIPYLITTLEDPIWWVRYDALRGLELMLRSDTSIADETRRALLANIDNQNPFARNLIAALLTNSGAVEELLSTYKEAGRRGADARRLLAFIYDAGGAPEIAADQQWLDYYQDNRPQLRRQQI